MSSTSSSGSTSSQFIRSRSPSSSAHGENHTPSSDDQEESTITTDLVITKYKMTGEIVNDVLKQLIASCKVGASVLELCSNGDSLIKQETQKVFKKAREVKKGLAFPTCISVNNCIANFAPASKAQDVLLKNEDVVKIELGAHIDGYIATVAHTIVVSSNPSSKVTGKRADVILAAHYASEAAFRLLKPDNDMTSITNTVQSMANVYQCKAVKAIPTHKLSRYNMNDKKVLSQDPEGLQNMQTESSVIKAQEAYAINAVISTGEGVGRPEKSLATVYRKTAEIYKLKQKSSREFHAEVEKNFGMLPFSIREFDNNVKAKLGLVECVKHNVIEPFPVAFEKLNDFVASFVFTVLLMPNGPHRITGIPFERDVYESEYSYLNSPTLKLLMGQTGNPVKARKKKARNMRKSNPPI